MVKAKFKCTRIELWENGGQITLNPVAGGSEENDSFWKATPAGEINLTIDNIPALVLFKPGNEYYVSFENAKADR